MTDAALAEAERLATIAAAERAAGKEDEEAAPAPEKAPVPSSGHPGHRAVPLRHVDVRGAVRGGPRRGQRGPHAARRGDSLRAELAVAHHKAHGKPPTASALADALLTLEGQAMTAPREAVALRVAGHEGRVVVDLGDETGRAAIVGPDRWELINRSPVLFRRTELTGALPAPEPDGSLSELRGLLNVSDDTWPLVLGWLVAALMPAIPHPVLLLGGEQGTGKSTAETMLAALVDPSPAQLRSIPRDPEQWAVAASGSWVVPLDNVSAITPWLSDAICRAVTGDGTVRRRLYSNDSLTVLAFRRVVMLSAIDTGALRGDLADRLLLADLDRIDTTDRRDDAELAAAYAAGRPRCLGALLTLTSKVLAVLPTVKLTERPRMADFARVLAAVDQVLGTTALDTYRRQDSRLAVEVIDSDPVAAADRAHLDNTGEWTGTAGDLLDRLTADRPPKGWRHRPGACRRRCAGPPPRCARSASPSTSRTDGDGREQPPSTSGPDDENRALRLIFDAWPDAELLAHDDPRRHPITYANGDTP